MSSPNPVPGTIEALPTPVTTVQTGWNPSAIVGMVCKVFTLLGLFGAALHAWFPPDGTPRDYAGGYQYLLAGLAMLGISVKLHAVGKVAENAAVASEVNTRGLNVAVADLENIRQNPAQPGTPLTEQEQQARVAALSGSGLTKFTGKP